MFFNDNNNNNNNFKVDEGLTYNVIWCNILYIFIYIYIYLARFEQRIGGGGKRRRRRSKKAILYNIIIHIIRRRVFWETCLEMCVVWVGAERERERKKEREEGSGREIVKGQRGQWESKREMKWQWMRKIRPSSIIDGHDLNWSTYRAGIFSPFCQFNSLSLSCFHSETVNHHQQYWSTNNNKLQYILESSSLLSFPFIPLVRPWNLQSSLPLSPLSFGIFIVKPIN